MRPCKAGSSAVLEEICQECILKYFSLDRGRVRRLPPRVLSNMVIPGQLGKSSVH